MEKHNKKKTIIISGVNLFEGGTLTIIKDNLKFANDFLSDKYRIIALVFKKDLFRDQNLSNIIFLEFPKSRKSYFIRLYLEYVYFKKLSNKLKPYLWFSLHDITPNVNANVQVVYCHNPTPFKKVLFSDLLFQPILFCFTLFYKYLYQINLKKNKYVVVQQTWIKKEFLKLFHLNGQNVVVCYPEVKESYEVERTERLNNLEEKLDEKNNIFTFFYPALARPFKNFEIIGDAIKILKKRGINNFRVIITINGKENNYAKYILKKYGNLEELLFLGMLSFKDVNEKYLTSDALLFPSTLETWGLPITEFKAYKKPIILSRLPYAFETLGQYNKGCFFDPMNAFDLADKMFFLINGNPKFDLTSKIDDEILTGWSELYNKILS